jgi:transcriptional regulator with XRE-family HTH domain
MIRVEVRPELLRWARKRAGFSVVSLARRFPKVEAWERGEARPTLKQLESFAKATYTPVGFLFLKKVKIPEPCIGLGIKCMTPFEMLRRERARFVLGRFGAGRIS